MMEIRERIFDYIRSHSLKSERVDRLISLITDLSRCPIEDEHIFYAQLIRDSEGVLVSFDVLDELLDSMLTLKRSVA